MQVSLVRKCFLVSVHQIVDSPYVYLGSQVSVSTTYVNTANLLLVGLVPTGIGKRKHTNTNKDAEVHI